MKNIFNIERTIRFLSAFIDFFALQLALILGYWLWVRFPWHGNWQYFADFAPILYVVPPLGIIVFKAIGLYKSEMGVIGVHEQSSIFSGIWITYFTVIGISFFYREVEFSRLAVLYSMFISVALISVERFFIRCLYIWLHKHGIGVKHAVIYGAGFNGQRLERWISQSPKLGIKILGFLDDYAQTLVKKPETLPIIGGIAHLHELIQKKNAEILFVAHRGIDEDQIIEIIQLCRLMNIRCWIMPSLYRFYAERVEIQNIGGIPLVGFRENFGRHSYEVVKHTLDKILAVILILVTAPLWIAVGAGIYATLGRPLFFRQVRIGKNHKQFTIYKFRTMKPSKGKDAVSPELQKQTEAMTTPFSAFLRKTGLDEIPQLINVLKGEMSLIGPRPEMPFLVDRYGPLERERLTVRPGISGLWQVSDDRKRLLIHENMDYDLYYVKNMSFNLDLAITLKTVESLIKRVLKRDTKQD